MLSTLSCKLKEETREAVNRETLLYSNTTHSCAAERVLTTWLTLIGKNEHKPPLITVTLTSVGSELRSVRATVSSPTEEYLRVHPALVKEYESADTWPKHVLILYKWETFNDVNATGGIFVLLSSGLPAPYRLCVT